MKLSKPFVGAVFTVLFASCVADGKPGEVEMTPQKTGPSSEPAPHPQSTVLPSPAGETNQPVPIPPPVTQAIRTLDEVDWKNFHAHSIEFSFPGAKSRMHLLEKREGVEFGLNYISFVPLFVISPGDKPRLLTAYIYHDASKEKLSQAFQSRVEASGSQIQEIIRAEDNARIRFATSTMVEFGKRVTVIDGLIVNDENLHVSFSLGEQSDESFLPMSLTGSDELSKIIKKLVLSIK